MNKNKTGFAPLNISKTNLMGFTLVELLVSISIIGIMSTIVMVNFRASRSSAELRMAAQKLASEIRKVQGYSLGLKENAGSVPAGGWGVHITTQNPFNHKFTVFANTDGDWIMDGGEEVRDIKYSHDENIVANDMIKHSGGNSWNFGSISFTPPDSDVILCRQNNSAQCADTSIEIVLENQAGDQVSVIVNKFGLVDVVY